MFEKEAEEWRNSLNYEIDNDTFNNIVIPCIEFSYNKANEKAKEIIREFMRISTVCDEDFEPDYSVLIDEAEKFLKEVEK